jgi:hypothetical protein
VANVFQDKLKVFYDVFYHFLIIFYSMTAEYSKFLKPQFYFTPILLISILMLSCGQTVTPTANVPSSNVIIKLETTSVLDTIRPEIDNYYDDLSMFTDSSCIYQYTSSDSIPRLIESYNCNIVIKSQTLTETDILNNVSWTGYATLHNGALLESYREYVDKNWSDWIQGHAPGMSAFLVGIKVIKSQIILEPRDGADRLTKPTPDDWPNLF